MKKSSMLKYGIAVLLLCVCNTSYAEDTFTVNGITYKLATTSTVVIVKMDVPSDGHVVFPSSIEYRDRTFTVTGIGIGGDCVFNNPEALESMVIPATIKGFGCSGSGLERYYSYIFDKCVNLKKVVIEDSEEDLYFYPNKSDSKRGGAMFCYCPLEEVYIGRNVSYITERVSGYGDFYYSPFKNQSKLKNVKIGEKVTTLGDAYMFGGCTSLEKIEIPGNIKEIPEKTFAGCSSLSNVILHEGLLTIKSEAFSDVPISSISLPNSVVELGRRCLYGNNLISIVINDNIKKIDDEAFYSSTLTKVVFGRSVEYIGGSVFGNSSLQEIVCRIINPENCKVAIHSSYRVEETFSTNNYTWATLYVPYGTIEKYKTYDPWYNFVTIVEGEPTGISPVMTTSTQPIVVYDINGNQSLQPRKGVNIVRMSNGKTKKVVVK